MRRDGFYHSALVLQKPNRTLLNNNNKFTISTILPSYTSYQIVSPNKSPKTFIFQLKFPFSNPNLEKWQNNSWLQKTNFLSLISSSTQIPIFKPKSWKVTKQLLTSKNQFPIISNWRRLYGSIGVYAEMSNKNYWSGMNILLLRLGYQNQSSKSLCNSEIAWE